MLLEPECLGCLINQVYKALILLKPTISKGEIIEAQRKMMQFMINSNVLTKPGPLIGMKTYQIVAETLNEKDPYKNLKLEYNNLAMKYYDKAKKIIDNAENPLFEAIAIAAIGNTIDFGAHYHKLDLISDLNSFTPDKFKINDIPEFRKSLKDASNNSNKILILLDNAGEIVFDKILIETLQQLYPTLEIVCAVRSEPIINDVTMEDAEYVGLTKKVKVIEAQATPGIELSMATKEFKEYFFEENSIILSKGQGNFESLYGMEIPKKDIYFLLKAKCPLMERVFNVEIGDLIFKKKTIDF